MKMLGAGDYPGIPVSPFSVLSTFLGMIFTDLNASYLRIIDNIIIR